jgi:hypothetical protein
MDAPTAEEAAPVKLSLGTKNDTSGKSATAETTHLEAVKAMIEERGLTEKFDKFLPTAEPELYIFKEPANEPGHWKLAADKQGSLILLGQNEKSPDLGVSNFAQ